MFYPTILHLIFIHLWSNVESTPLSYFANYTACYIDGKVYQSGELIPSAFPCEVCRCRPPGFTCDLKHCPTAKIGCRAREVPGECCPEYDCGCLFNGINFAEGEKIPHSPNPCMTCFCRANIVRCGFNECKFRFDCEPEYVAGQCCPRYDHCNGKELDKNLISNYRNLDKSDNDQFITTELSGHDLGTKLPIVEGIIEDRKNYDDNLRSEIGRNYGQRKKKLISHFNDNQLIDLNTASNYDDNQILEITTQPWFDGDLTSQRLTTSKFATEHDQVDLLPLSGSISDEMEVSTESTVYSLNNDADDYRETSTMNVIENESITTIRPLISHNKSHHKVSQGYMRSIYRGTLNLLGNIMARFG